MIKYFYYLSIFIILLTGCIKESNTISTTYFINTTQHKIEVNAYLNGYVQTNSSFVLNANESKMIFNFNYRGIGSGVSYGYINHPMDSFTVKFDDLYSISHYKPNLIGTSLIKYLYDSKRNLYNDSSYVSDITKDSKYRREWDFKYTFTEQDFLDVR